MVRKIQAASGMLFGARLAAHLNNIWAAVAGAGGYAALQRVLSFGYRAPVLEWLIQGRVVRGGEPMAE